MDGGLRIRIRWLASPWFVLSIAVLALNDHVLKDSYGTWWTGKLSDVAGVAMVGFLAAVVCGRRVGVTATAVGFAALKLVPGVAEAAAPALGGVTLRDPTDLLGLAVLVPVWFVLRSSVDRPTATPPAPGPPVPGPPIGRGRRAAAALPLVTVGLAIAAGTATSCAEPLAIDRVVAQDGAIYAMRSYTPEPWWRSTDGGRTWKTSPAPTGFEGAYGLTGNTNATGGTIPPPDREVCATDGSCLRVTSGYQIERRAVGGALTTEHVVPLDKRNKGNCSGGGDDLDVQAVALVDPASTERAVASYGTGGVVVRQPDGTWTPDRSMLPPRDPDGVSGFSAGDWAVVFGAATVGVLVLAGVAALVVWAVRSGRRPPPGPRPMGPPPMGPPPMGPPPMGPPPMGPPPGSRPPTVWQRQPPS